MNEYIVKVSVIKTKERKVFKYTVVQKANSILEAEKLVKEKMIKKKVQGAYILKRC